MKKLIFLLLAATLYSADIYAIGYYSWSDTLNVFALSGLRLRDKPGGAVIATAPYGSKITMQEQQPNDRRDTIENIPGHWAKAVWQGKEGYVFDGFLSRLPAPDAGLNTLEAYCDRFFRFREDPPVSDVEAEDHIDMLRYRSQNWHIVLERSESADNAEAYGYEDIMTIKSGNGISPEEMYLLMRALFRDEIAKCLEKIKTKGSDSGGFYKTADENYFRFVRGAKSGSYEFPGELYLFLEYGVCIHGAYIRFGAAD